MKKLLITITILLFSSCGKETKYSRTLPVNGIDGSSCSVSSILNGAKITCTDGSFSTIYSGLNGTNGQSCSALPVSSGVSVVCGDSPAILLYNGLNGINGVNSTSAIQPGLLCSVYDSNSVDRSSGLMTILNNSSAKFTKVINQLDINDVQSVKGFPKFTLAEQALIGTEDYALDCSGYLNIPVSGNYQFRLLSDDGSRLAINNNVLVNMDQLQSPTYGHSTSTLLYKGPNKINVLYFQGPNSKIALKLDWLAPTSSGILVLQQLPSNYLTH